MKNAFWPVPDTSSYKLIRNRKAKVLTLTVFPNCIQILKKKIIKKWLLDLFGSGEFRKFFDLP